VLKEAAIRVRLTKPGRFRVAVRWSPYWHAHGACLQKRADGMMTLTSPRPGVVPLTFHVTVHRALAALAGHAGSTCGPAAQPLPT
jgi:hypothetical protein